MGNTSKYDYEKEPTGIEKYSLWNIISINRINCSLGADEKVINELKITLSIYQKPTAKIILNAEILMAYYLMIRQNKSAAYHLFYLTVCHISWPMK